MTAIPMTLTVNGQRTTLEVEPHVVLLDLLRDELGLTGAKRSCDLQVCGACTVLVNGKPVSACTFLAFEARDAEVTTIEGLSSDVGATSPSTGSEPALRDSKGRAALHPLQQAFIDHAGFQCGFCTPGMILAAKSLMDENPHPTEAEIVDYMAGNLCRCTGYKKVVEAIQAAAEAQ